MFSVDCTVIYGNLCAPYRVAHVLPPQAVAGAHLPADRGEPKERRSGAPAGDRDARAAGRTRSQWTARSAAALRRALRPQAMVLDAARAGDAATVTVRRIGPALLFERLWQE